MPDRVTAPYDDSSQKVNPQVSSRPLRTPARAAALTGALLLCVGALAACGDDDAAGAGDGLDSVSVSGDPGKAPTVKFDGIMEPDGTEAEVVTEGDGDKLGSGDSVLAHIWVGNGYTGEKAFSTYDSKKPELLTLDGQLSGPLQEAVEGHTVGSRVAVATTAESAFGEGGNPQLGIGNKDGVVFVVDLVSKIASEPSGEDREPAKWAPTLVEEDGVITGLDFTDANKPSKNLLDTTLVKGDGPVVKKGQTLYVNYLGQVYDAEEPFDESYSATPASFPIGVGQVVKGWDEELVGKTVGSRVILSIPPAFGYGDKGQKDAGIKGTDTLYFVVDLLAAS